MSENRQLNIWCGTQREKYRLNKLEQYKIELLEKLDFKWQVLEEIWKERYLELKEFKNQNGHANVPRRYEPNPTLANWCQMQRANYKARIEKGSTAISDEKIKLLEELGFIWNLEEFAWNNNYNELSNYYTKTNDYSHKGNIEKTLKQWTVRQRQLFKKGKLTQDRIDKLISIGFKF